MEEKTKELQRCLQAMYKEPDGNLGWSFDYSFLKRVSDMSENYEERISMEQLDAALLSILNIDQP